jgi:hypothetical protein
LQNISQEFFPVEMKKRIYLFIKKNMIRLETYEGILLNIEDSQSAIKFEIKRLFKSFSNFNHCEYIKHSDYWGDVQLLGTEDEFCEWIIQFAKQILEE